MIPTDVLSRLRADTAADRALQPVAPAARLADILADFQPGQRIMAEIQALLPNGAYRAIVGQREITLALPLSAKAGDALELEVVDNDGQLTLALLAGKNKEAGAAFSTNFSSAGQLITGLLQHSQQEQGKKGVQLNGGIPLLPEISDTQPLTGEALAPALQKAVNDSGMFYEAHQAQWVNGQQNLEQLLREPQGKLSSPVDLHKQASNITNTNSSGVLDGSLSTDLPQADLSLPSRAALADQQARPVSQQSEIFSRQVIQHSDDNRQGVLPADTPPSRSGFANVPESLTPIVQQQLDTLSSQTLHWQGQVWPGQIMEWEVQEQQARERDAALPDETEQRWRTRLRLELPGLGQVEANLVLQGNQTIEIQLQASNAETQVQLRNNGLLLQNQLEDAGLQLSQFGVRAPSVKPEQDTDKNKDMA